MNLLAGKTVGHRSIRLRWLGAIETASVSSVAARRRSRRRAAAMSLLAGLCSFVILQAPLAWYLDGKSPGRRDPEYARRVILCRARLAEHPHRPLVAVLGNSRTAMAVCPAVWETDLLQTNDQAPLLFNFGLVGAGPLLQQLTAQRLLNDGIQPAMVLWEYWPPFLHYDEQWNDWQRLNQDRLSPRDLPWLEAHCPPEAKDALRHRIWTQHLLPCWGSRHRLLLQLVPEWLPRSRRIDWTWSSIDPWGWHPPLDSQVLGSAGRLRLTEHCQAIYQPLLARYSPAEAAEICLQRGIRLLQAAGVKVVLLYLPESPRFRSWYPEPVQQYIEQQRQRLTQQLGVPWLDARSWMVEEDFVDGFHLSRQGAVGFTRRLARLLVAEYRAYWHAR
ncbi:MAG: hypothetical protein NZU63_08335 [Gemmataceae bacterium]|nr:hypothetical protein [Gemmataceae bacterium]